MKVVRWQVLFRREGILRHRRFLYQDNFEKARLEAIRYSKEHDGIYEGIFKWLEGEFEHAIAKVQTTRKRLKEYREKPKKSHHRPNELENNLISDED